MSILEKFKILCFFISKFNQKIWLTIITIIVILMLLNQFKLFSTNILTYSMKNYIENHKYIKHRIEMILTETVKNISKNKKGTAILEVIPTINQGTLTNPNYWGYVSYLMEWDEIEQKVINSLETRLKADKVNIPYDTKVSKKIHEYASDDTKEKSIFLTVDEMIKNIDDIRMKAMWRTETVSDTNGRKYYGNFDFIVEAGAWAFVTEKEEMVLQVILIMDKEFMENSQKEEYMPELRKARNEIKLLFSK